MENWRKIGLIYLSEKYEGADRFLRNIMTLMLSLLCEHDVRFMSLKDRLNFDDTSRDETICHSEVRLNLF